MPLKASRFVKFNKKKEFTMQNRSDFKTVPLSSLVSEVKWAHDQEKYTFILDAQGNVNTFFQYKGMLCDFNKQMMKVQMKMQTPEEATESIRKCVVNAVRNGESLNINIDILSPDFNGEYLNDSTVNMQKVLDW